MIVSNHIGIVTPIIKKRKKRFSLDNPFPKERKERITERTLHTIQRKKERKLPKERKKERFSLNER